MKKTTHVLLTALIVIAVTAVACQNSNQNVDNQDSSSQSQIAGQDEAVTSDDTNNSMESVNESSSQSESSAVNPKNDEPGYGEANDLIDHELGVSGAQVVDLQAGKLMNKLRLTDDQHKMIKQIMSEQYQSSGKSLDEIYSVDESKNLGREIRKDAYDEIMDVLDEDQRMLFEKFMNK